MRGNDMNAKKDAGVERNGAGAVAARAFRGLFLEIGLAIFVCFEEMIDSFSDGFTDVLFEDET